MSRESLTAFCCLVPRAPPPTYPISPGQAPRVFTIAAHMMLHYLDCSCNALVMTIMLPILLLWTSSMLDKQSDVGPLI